MTPSTNLRLPNDVSSPIPPGLKEASRDARALRIVAKTIYRELRQGGLAEEDLMFLAGELLSLVTSDVKDRRRTQAEPAGPAMTAPLLPPR